MQQMRNRPRFSYRLIQELNCFRQQTLLALAGKHLQIHLHARQILSQTIVQLAGEFPAFRVLQLEQPAGEAAEGFLAIRAARSAPSRALSSADNSR